MRNLKTFVIMLVALVAPSSQAQLGPDLLVMGGLKAFDSFLGAIIPPKRNVINPSKMVFDVYLDQHSEKCSCKADQLVYWFTIDSTVAAYIPFGDRVVLKVKSFKGGQPGRSATLYVNEGSPRKQKIDGDRGTGFVGGYPFVWINNLDVGANQLKNVFSHNEYCEGMVIRMDVRQWYRLAQDEDNLLNVAGSSHLGSGPYMPIFTTVLNGQVRAFASAEEGEAEIESMNQGQSNRTNGSLGQVAPPARQETLPVTPPRNEEQASVDTYGVLYKLAETNNLDQAAKALKVEQLRASALDRTDIDINKPVQYQDECGLMLVFRSNSPFTVELVDPNNSVLQKKESVVSQEGGYELLYPLVFKTVPKNRLVINGRWTVTFQKRGK